MLFFVYKTTKNVQVIGSFYNLQEIKKMRKNIHLKSKEVNIYMLDDSVLKLKLNLTKGVENIYLTTDLYSNQIWRIKKVSTQKSLNKFFSKYTFVN